MVVLGALGVKGRDTGQTKQKLTQMLKQGNYMSQHETGYGASGSDGGGSQYSQYSGYSGYGSDGNPGIQACSALVLGRSTTTM